MCGIVGALDLGGGLPTPDVFDAMVDALAHRGPDGRGVYRSGGIALGHRRLGVLDPTPAGAQPWIDAERGIALTYNGEIYNFRSLRRRLEALGHRFRTRCDTEVLVAAYDAWGIDCLRELRGMFAFGLWDIRRRRLWLVRDHVGIKPLFHTRAAGRLMFASEAKALVADPAVPRAADLDAIDSVLTLCYAPAPFSPFAGISRLPPGHMLIADAGGVRVERYWRPTYTPRPASAEAITRAFGERLSEAVTSQMCSDVPLGAFLSGGLDSTAIVAAMAAAGHRPLTCTVGFESASFDERAGARETADRLGCAHHVEVVPLDLEQLVVETAHHDCDLIADASMLAVDRLCAATRKHVTVALSGDGADELLAGYATYPATGLARVWRGVPSIARRTVAQAVMASRPTGRRYGLVDWAQRFVTGAEAGPGADHASWRRYLRAAERVGITRGALADRDGGGAIARYAAVFDELPAGTPSLRRMLHADFGFYLPADMLTKVDRASMRHSLEVRVPFLDQDFVAWAHTVPLRHLYSPRRGGKAVLRRHLHRTLGPTFGARRKRGFNVPLADAFRGGLGDLLLDTVRSSPFVDDGPIEPAGVEALLGAHRAGRVERSYPLYAILKTALWWQRWLA